MTGNGKMKNMISELWNGLSMGNMVSEEDYAKLEGAKEVEFHDDRDEIDIYY